MDSAIQFICELLLVEKFQYKNKIAWLTSLNKLISKALFWDLRTRLDQEVAKLH